MGFIPTITCRKCRRQYSGLLKKCPHCGTRRQSVSTRPAATTDSVQKGTAASARALENNQWQLIFGLILLAAVMLSVIVLITAGINGREEAAAPTDDISLLSPPPSTAVTETPTPTPTPTPVVAPTSVSIYFLTDPVESGFTTIVGESVQLNASVYPLDIASVVEWRSTDESVFTVDQTGKVTGKGAGTATLIASCGGIQDECQVIVRQSW